MDGSRLVSAPPIRPTPKPLPNFHFLLYLILFFLLVLFLWLYRLQIIQIYHSTSLKLTTGSPTPPPAWAIYSNPDFKFDYPGSWGPIQKTPTGCGFIESIASPEEEYEITITTRCNYNTATGRPYASITDYLRESPSKISYITVDSIQIAKISSYLASSKASTEIVFFSPNKVIYDISLAPYTRAPDPSPLPDSVIPVFSRIISTLKFIR